MSRSTLTFSYSITAAEAKISEADLKAIKADGRVYALDFLQDVIFEATKAYNEILASDGVDKAAGGSGQDAVPGSIKPSVMADGIDAAPAAAPVCEWTDVGDAWDTSCGGWHTSWATVVGKIICPACRNTIKFKEGSE